MPCRVTLRSAVPHSGVWQQLGNNYPKIKTYRKIKTYPKGKTYPKFNIRESMMMGRAISACVSASAHACENRGREPRWQRRTQYYDGEAPQLALPEAALQVGQALAQVCAVLVLALAHHLRTVGAVELQHLLPGRVHVACYPRARPAARPSPPSVSDPLTSGWHVAQFITKVSCRSVSVPGSLEGSTGAQSRNLNCGGVSSWHAVIANGGRAPT